MNVNNINKTNNYLSSQIIEHKNDHDTDVGNPVHGGGGGGGGGGGKTGKIVYIY